MDLWYKLICWNWDIEHRLCCISVKWFWISLNTKLFHTVWDNDKTYLSPTFDWSAALKHIPWKENTKLRPWKKWAVFFLAHLWSFLHFVTAAPSMPSCIGLAVLPKTWWIPLLCNTWKWWIPPFCAWDYPSSVGDPLWHLYKKKLEQHWHRPFVHCVLCTGKILFESGYWAGQNYCCWLLMFSLPRARVISCLFIKTQNLPISVLQKVFIYTYMEVTHAVNQQMTFETLMVAAADIFNV